MWIKCVLVYVEEERQNNKKKIEEKLNVRVNQLWIDSKLKKGKPSLVFTWTKRKLPKPIEAKTIHDDCLNNKWNYFFSFFRKRSK